MSVCNVVCIWIYVKHWNSDGQTPPPRRRLGPNSLKEEYQRVVIGVYYEALCPDSKNFIIRQLLPTYKKLKDQVIIQLIPYGKAKTENTSDGPEFDCQHGPTECEANMIHSCAIEVLRDQNLVLKYIFMIFINNCGLDQYH
ncbi:hypothetical protein HCN44_009969 [Aphidius gifuensis]|uniref:Uncharacterized protein n=1 Tax=Aphidius gifuensis TaxID=684658 RepID=A0A835CWE8_APHGI|nr:hypothetical protein HCN44_009969 [Aphidius gifuensis]